MRGQEVDEPFKRADDPCDDWSLSDLGRLNDERAPERTPAVVDVEEDQATDMESRVA